MENKQTWWDEDIKERYDEFKSWVGDNQAPSKKAIRELISKHEYKTLLDFGCGMCDDYFAYAVEQPELHWTGVEGSFFLANKAMDRGIPVSLNNVESTPFEDDTFDVSYSRHVVEHQRDFKPMFEEMIRVAKKAMIHIFFIPPGDEEIINYDEKQNLYHNTFKKTDIEGYLYEFDKVNIVTWVPLTKTEIALVVHFY